MWSIGDDHGVRGGRLEHLVDTAIAANALGAQSLRQHCDELADLCLERAAACDDYERQLENWNRSVAAWKRRRDSALEDPDRFTGHFVIGPRPLPPAAPPSWVEVE